MIESKFSFRHQGGPPSAARTRAGRPAGRACGSSAGPGRRRPRALRHRRQNPKAAKSNAAHDDQDDADPLAEEPGRLERQGALPPAPPALLGDGAGNGDGGWRSSPRRHPEGCQTGRPRSSRRVQIGQPAGAEGHRESGTRERLLDPRRPARHGYACPTRR